MKWTTVVIVIAIAGCATTTTPEERRAAAERHRAAAVAELRNSIRLAEIKPKNGQADTQRATDVAACETEATHHRADPGEVHKGRWMPYYGMGQMVDGYGKWERCMTGRGYEIVRTPQR